MQEENSHRALPGGLFGHSVLKMLFNSYFSLRLYFDPSTLRHLHLQQIPAEKVDTLSG